MNRSALNLVLAKDAWFAGLPPELAEGILCAGRLKAVKDAPLYRETDKADGLLAVVSGQVRTSRVSSDGQMLFLMVAAPGSWLGVPAALDGKPYGHDAFAVGNTVTFHLGRDRMKSLMGERLDFHSAFVGLLCAEHRNAVEDVIARRNQCAFQTLAAELLRLADLYGRQTSRGILIDLRLSQEALATMVGVGRQSINRMLRTLTQHGIAAVNYASIVVHDIRALKQISTIGSHADR